MDSYARLSGEERHSRLRPEGPWSEYELPPVTAVEDGLDRPRLLADGTRLAGWTAGARGFPMRSATTDRTSSIVESSSLGRSLNGHPEADRQGFPADQLIDDLRRAMEQNPEATRAAVLQLVTFLTPPAVVEPVTTRGGLAPWQKRKVERYLRQNLDRPMRLSAVAEQVALSVSYFSRAFKQTFGSTPHTHMLRLRIELAQKLMLTTEEPLSQIAPACGLADQAHLSKLFRRLVGETPNAWRRRNLTDSQAEARSSRATRGQFPRPVSGAGCIAVAG
jgi:AraC family transcriptional regulator